MTKAKTRIRFEYRTYQYLAGDWRLETYHVSELQPGEVVGREQLGPALLGQVDVEVDGGVQDCQEMGDLADGVNPARPLVLLLVL